MDWSLFWSAVAAGSGLLTASSGIVVFIIRSHTARLETQIENVANVAKAYTDAAVAKAIADHQKEISEAVREHVELAIDARVAKLANEITTRINGTYMRSGEAQARFSDLQRQIDSLK